MWSQSSCFFSLTLAARLSLFSGLISVFLSIGSSVRQKAKCVFNTSSVNILCETLLILCMSIYFNNDTLCLCVLPICTLEGNRHVLQFYNPRLNTMQGTWLMLCNNFIKNNNNKWPEVSQWTWVYFILYLTGVQWRLSKFYVIMFILKHILIPWGDRQIFCFVWIIIYVFYKSY